MKATRIYQKPRNAGAPTCTGVVGVSFFATAKFRKNGAVRRYYRVAFKRADGRKSYRPFCIDTLGQAEAWKRALRFRSEYEATVRNLNLEAGTR